MFRSEIAAVNWVVIPACECGRRIASSVCRAIMDPLTTTAASGMRARMETLDMLANNIANSSSAGFKADTDFYGLYHSEEAASDSGLPAPTESPVTEKQWTDFSQGQITPTGNELDLALSGEGFFTVQGPNGVLYTRNGSFRVSNDGTLTTRQGYPVLNAENKPIRIDGTKSTQVDGTGRILQGGNEVAQFKLVNFTAPRTLEKQESTYFRLSVSTLTPAPATDVKVEQRSVESANVQPAQAAVKLVSVMRQFEMLQRAMSIGNEMNKQAVEDVARTSG